MKNSDEEFKEGTIVALSSGEYDDYQVECLVKVTKAFKVDDCFVEWAKSQGLKIVKDTVPYLSNCETEEVEFIPWLIDSPYVESISYRDIHTGSYGDTTLRSY